MATDEELEAWCPKDAVEALKLERSVYPEKTDAEVARDILMRGAPIAAASVVHLAAHARAENVRLAAARYVVDGILGGGFNFGINVDDNLLALVTQLADNDIAREIVEGGPIA